METQSDEGQFDASRMNHRIIQILPTNEDILKIVIQLNT